MIKTAKWNEFLTKIGNINYFASETEMFKTLESLRNIDNLMRTQYDMKSRLESALTQVIDDYLKPSNNNLWKDLKIAYSSFKEFDKRPVLKILDNLSRYTGFYLKVLQDKGFAQSLVTNRNYQNNSTLNDTNRNYDSQTPNIELDNFEDGIKYASSLSKDSRDSTTNNNGTSTDNTKATSFKEAEKNLNYIFYNDLMNYITNIPNMLYSLFSLDTYPIYACR